MKEAVESSSKEAIYALDLNQGPFKIFNCLIPEIEAHRPLGAGLTDKGLRQNYDAQLKLAMM